MVWNLKHERHRSTHDITKSISWFKVCKGTDVNCEDAKPHWLGLTLSHSKYYIFINISFCAIYLDIKYIYAINAVNCELSVVFVCARRDT